MDYNRYIKAAAGEIYSYYLDYLFETQDKGMGFATELKNSARYEEDFEFRATVDLIYLIASTSITPMDKIVSEALDLLDRTMALELWQLVAHCWNILGSTYARYKMDERAVECFIRAVQVETRHGLTAVTFVAYFNLGVIYFELGMHEKSLGYIRKSSEALDRHSTSNVRYINKLFNNYAITLQILRDLNREEEFEEQYLKFKSLCKGELTPFQEYVYFSNEVQNVFYLYSKGKCSIEHCIETYKKSETYFVDLEAGLKVPHYYNFIDFCMTKRIHHKYFEEDVRSLERLLPTEDSPKMNATAYRRIIDFYKETGDEEKVAHFKDLYLDALYASNEQYREQQKNSIDLVETLLIDTVSTNELGNQNQELKTLYKEALKIKKELQDAYHRIESINKIGKQLTSALSLNEVIGKFHEVLTEHFRIDTFILFVADEERSQLRSCVFYYNGTLQPELIIDFDDSESLSAECYRKNELINLDPDKQRRAKRLGMKEKITMHSATYLPLSVGDKVIGVYTIQHRDYNIYKDELEFLRALAPFVAIALNNAVRSWSLEKEIYSHIETQNRLKAANKSLERISMQDGLTHISSRRNFEHDVIELIGEAISTEETVSVFMIDVDFFKLYNDTYGHLEGDEVLKKVANIFKDHMDAAGGLSARFGGEEFVGACKGLTFEENRNLAEKIRLSVYDLNIEHRVTPLGRITVSIGVSFETAAPSITRTDMMRLADILLYKAKNSGRNKSVIGNLKRKNAELTRE